MVVSALPRARVGARHVIVLVSGATRALATAPPWVGRLIVPSDQKNPAGVDDGRPWAMDNECFTGPFNAELFVRMLERYAGHRGCLFVTAPDVLERRADGTIRGDSRATVEKFARWARVIRAFGFPPALVLQDGITSGDIPWDHVDALFVGGSTAFKYSPIVCDLIAIARARGKHTHMGRVSGPGRWHHARDIGVLSYDSSGFSRYFDEMCGRVARWQRSPRLPLTPTEDRV